MPSWLVETLLSSFNNVTDNKAGAIAKYVYSISNILKPLTYIYSYNLSS